METSPVDQAERLVVAVPVLRGSEATAPVVAVADPVLVAVAVVPVPGLLAADWRLVAGNLPGSDWLAVGTGIEAGSGPTCNKHARCCF